MSTLNVTGQQSSGNSQQASPRVTSSRRGGYGSRGGFNSRGGYRGRQPQRTDDRTRGVSVVENIVSNSVNTPQQVSTQRVTRRTVAPRTVPQRTDEERQRYHTARDRLRTTVVSSLCMSSDEINAEKLTRGHTIDPQTGQPYTGVRIVLNPLNPRDVVRLPQSDPDNSLTFHRSNYFNDRTVRQHVADHYTSIGKNYRFTRWTVRRGPRTLVGWTIDVDF